MSKRDYYEVLNITKTATTVEIKKSYRRLAMKYHPDRNLDDAEAEGKFKECKEAYEALSDSQKRAAYDQFGHAGLDQQAGFGAGGGAGFGDVFGDVFGDIFGQRRGGSRSYRGADIQYELDISLEQAVFGTDVEIELNSAVNCEKCEGKGTKEGTERTQCETCGGVGQVRIQQGFFSVQQACPTCKGSGSIIKDPCDACHGEGRVTEARTIEVNIPAGVDTGDRIRQTGEGEAGMHGGQSGDLYIRVHVKEHSLFKRDGENLYCDVPISFITASLGGDVEVPTLDGKLKLTVPAETQSGKQFRLRGKGVKPVRGGPQGDIICRTMVETPVNLTKKQKDLLIQFGESMEKGGKRHNPREANWMDGARSFMDDLKSWIK